MRTNYKTLIVKDTFFDEIGMAFDDKIEESTKNGKF